MRPFFDMLFGSEPSTSLCELRWKPKGEPMRSELLPARAVAEIERRLAEHAAVGDCYVGVCPRREGATSGGADSVDRAHVLWADCDTAESVEALRRFVPTPACVVRSGSGGVHAYWPLWPPVEAEHVRRANRRIAHAIGADMVTTDPARILRPPNTLNWKHDPPKRVQVVRMASDVYEARRIVGRLPDPEPPKRRRTTVLFNPADPVETIPPEAYFARLAGLEPDREGMVRCPIPDHFDRTPSCRVYEAAEKGWYCYGCERGGRIYDLAGHVWNLEPRGDGFKEIKARLEREFGLVPV